MGFNHDYPSYSSLIYMLARPRRFDFVDHLLDCIRNADIRCGEALFVALIKHCGFPCSVYWLSAALLRDGMCTRYFTDPEEETGLKAIESLRFCSSRSQASFMRLTNTGFEYHVFL
ncbi:pentatricopeptide repeat-containing protein At1g07740, mitochondrial-like [Magnolia sinica]|uniref:pentatricopeptide repeat-containing protein At1g07740, mitochondrial-like n=1 Tax=Magnolia sinica TaxID=86752 RepID=UPI0026589D9A|nr:pentatricopeptide repeat-containing protein At1g07740, mitochondrial-like [Magnolia sinica]